MTTEMQTEERRALNAHRAAVALDMPIRSLYRAIEQGEIHAVKISGRWYVPVEVIDALLAPAANEG